MKKWSRELPSCQPEKHVGTSFIGKSGQRRYIRTYVVYFIKFHVSQGACSLLAEWFKIILLQACGKINGAYVILCLTYLILCSCIFVTQRQDLNLGLKKPQ